MCGMLQPLFITFANKEASNTLQTAGNHSWQEKEALVSKGGRDIS